MGHPALPAGHREDGVQWGALFAEDLHHSFVLGLVDLGECLGDQGPVFKAAGMQHLVEAEGSVTEQNLRVLEALVVFRHGEMDLMRQALDLPEQAGGFVSITGGVLAEAYLGHLVDEFGVEETLLTGLGLEDFGLERIDALLVEVLVVET